MRTTQSVVVPENPDRLAAAPGDPGARVFIESVPSGTRGFEDLAHFAITFRVSGINVRAAALKDIQRSKAASSRSQDRLDVVVLRQMLKRSESRGSE